MASLISSPAAVSYGATLTFETLTAEAALRLRPDEDTLLRVIDGVARLRFDGEEHVMGPGGEAIVPAGFHHTLCAVSGEARIVMGFRTRGAERVDQPVPADVEPLERPAVGVAQRARGATARASRAVPRR